MGTPTATPDAGPTWVAGFSPPAVQPGFTRYITPTVTNIQPGDNVEYCQWIAAPTGAAQDVLAFTGEQSPTGHHAVVYATTETKFPVGESHICTEDDMLSISFVGGIGNEGDAAKLPDGLFFRLPAGQALMVNTHWLNATDTTVDGQAVVDIQFSPASDSRTTADVFANNGDSFSIPPNAPATYDVSCKVIEDLNIAMVADHMHLDGTSAYTEVIHADTTTEMLVQDTTWSTDEQFNPKYTRFSLADPKVLHAGDTVHTHCEWMNMTSKTLLFPDEMCTGVGFYFPSHGQITCDDGDWSN